MGLGGRDGMGWEGLDLMGGMGWDGVGWDGMGEDGMGWGGMGGDGRGWGGCERGRVCLGVTNCKFVLSRLRK